VAGFLLWSFDGGRAACQPSAAMFIANAGVDFSTGYPQKTENGWRVSHIFPTLRNRENCYSDLEEKIKSNVCKTSSDTKTAWTSTGGG